MKLRALNIQNFKSIENVEIQISECSDESKTFGIIGENEAGKTSILKALGIVDNLTYFELKQHDFNDRNSPILIRFKYEISKTEAIQLISAIKVLSPQFDSTGFSEFHLQFEIYSQTLTSLRKTIQVTTYDTAYNIVVNPSTDLWAIVETLRHRTVYWTFDSKYLISKEIDLNTFFSSPTTTSIPLTNCFKLAGFETSQFGQVQSILSDSTEREDLRETLGTAVTNHLRKIWKKHKVKITFDITPSTLNFHVKDEGSKSKARTVEQRSDGFKQFISFLLTISAENKNSNLKNTILLLDEPETHLHPRAQEDFLQELIEITKNKNNNILFFATHSNYLIDKNILERNIKVVKQDDYTEISWFLPQRSTYASINYDVFGVYSADYHNELYDFLRESFSEDNNIQNLEINNFDDQYFKQILKLPRDRPSKGKQHAATLPTFIRNCIHYPSNRPKNFEELLEQSIEILVNKKNEINTIINRS